MNSKAVTTLLTILLFWQISVSRGQDGSVLGRRITLHAENQSLSNILDQISWQARVYFSYDASLINSSEIHSVEATDRSLFSVLGQLFNSSLYRFTELENQIVITKRNTEIPSIIRTDSNPRKYFFLSGKILEEKKKSPVSYATVSVLNNAVGTLSNSDGEFLLKLHPQFINDSLVISSMGFAQVIIPASRLLDDEVIFMSPISYPIREVRVTAISPEKLLENIRANLEKNYSSNFRLMDAFYREIVKQGDNYINVSEAVIEILKAPCNSERNDLSRLVKGRQSPDVQPFKWMNLKLQGGPFTITKLDIVKTMETFIDPKYQHQYDYTVSKVIWYNDMPVYVLEFEPVNELGFNGYTGELFVHRETYAIVYTRFGLNRTGLKHAASTLVKRTPPGVKARPSFVEYRVSYQKYQDKWHLNTARAEVRFKVRNRRDRITSDFQSVSDLLITSINPTGLEKFPREESFSHRDIFTEMINNYDPGFWENYNIIKPGEDLRNAIPALISKSD